MTPLVAWETDAGVELLLRVDEREGTARARVETGLFTAATGAWGVSLETFMVGIRDGAVVPDLFID